MGLLVRFMKTYAIIAALILAIPAFHFLATWGHREGRIAAYHLSVERCAVKYPRYRCEIEMSRNFPEVK